MLQQLGTPIRREQRCAGGQSWQQEPRQEVWAGQERGAGCPEHAPAVPLLLPAAGRGLWALLELFLALHKEEITREVVTAERVCSLVQLPLCRRPRSPFNFLFYP